MPSDSETLRSSVKARRTLEVCFQCRNRKVRCNGRKGGCENCLRLNFQCSLSRPDLGQESLGLETSISGWEGETSLDEPKLERCRVARACFPCRDKKTKCSGDLPSCQRCLRRRAQCLYPSVLRRSELGSVAPRSLPRRKTPEIASFSDRSSGSADLTWSQHSLTPPVPKLRSCSGSNKILIDQHIAAFFEFVYPIPCFGFIHKTTFLHSLSQNMHNPRLLQSICGVSARYLFPEDVERRKTAAKWIEEAEQHILARASEPTVSDVEALMLISLDHVVSRRFTKTMVSTALMVRLAYMMRLNHEDGRISSLAQERRTRLMWCIFVFDKFFSSGRAEFTLCPKDTMNMQLPWPEHLFLLDEPVATEPLRLQSNVQGPSKLGIMARCIRLLDIRDRISRLLQKILRHVKPLSHYLPKLESLEGELAALHLSLPSDSRFTSKNMLLRAYTPKRTTFVMYHIWWHQCHCDLYRFTIPGFREALPTSELENLPQTFTLYCRKKCLEHALGVAKVISTVVELGKDIFITDPSLAMCSFHSARIIFRLGQPELEDLATSEMVASLTACSKILNIQAEIYPTTKILQRGIQDLIYDVQNCSDGSVPKSSTWETTQSMDERDIPLLQSAVQISAVTPSVCSKYSIAEEIRNLEFSAEESCLPPNPSIAFDRVQGILNGAADVRDAHSRVDTTTQPSGQRGPPKSYYNAESSLTFADSQEAASTSNYDLWYGTEDGLSMMLGLDIDQALAQPDIFLDAFLQENSTVADAGETRPAISGV